MKEKDSCVNARRTSQAHRDLLPSSFGVVNISLPKKKVQHVFEHGACKRRKLGARKLH